MTTPKLPNFADPAVERAFSDFPQECLDGLLELRQFVFDVAASEEQIGDILETLKWGQPAYLTPTTKSGSTIRLGMNKQGGFAIFTHCQTTIMSEFRGAFPDDFVFEGNRAVHFQAGETLPLEKLQILIKRALTYKRG